MVLVDTSIWLMRDALSILHPYRRRIAICPPVVQELWQGAHDARAQADVVAIVANTHMLDAPVPLARFEAAAEIHRAARKASYTIRSSYDCLIAAIAIRLNVELVHADRDFDYIAEVTALRAHNINA